MACKIKTVAAAVGSVAAFLAQVPDASAQCQTLTEPNTVNFGNAVWWAIPWSWELVQGFYNLSAWLIAGAIMARFVTPKEPASTA